MSIAQRDAHQSDHVVGHNLNSDEGEHEGSEAKALVVKAPALDEEIEAVQLRRTQHGATYADEQQKDADQGKDSASIFVFLGLGLLVHCLSFLASESFRSRSGVAWHARRPGVGATA